MSSGVVTVAENMSGGDDVTVAERVQGFTNMREDNNQAALQAQKARGDKQVLWPVAMAALRDGATDEDIHTVCKKRVDTMNVPNYNGDKGIRDVRLRKLGQCEECLRAANEKKKRPVAPATVPVCIYKARCVAGTRSSFEVTFIKTLFGMM